MTTAELRSENRQLKAECVRLRQEREALCDTATAGALLVAMVVDDVNEIVRLLETRAESLNTWITHATAARAISGE